MLLQLTNSIYKTTCNLSMFRIYTQKKTKGESQTVLDQDSTKAYE